MQTLIQLICPLSLYIIICCHPFLCGVDASSKDVFIHKSVASFLSPILDPTCEWVQAGKDIDGESFGDYAGRDVALSSDGQVVAVSSPRNDGPGGTVSDSGSVRVYKLDIHNVRWEQIGQDIDGEAMNDLSGYSISLNDDGTIVAIGSDQHDNERGHVRVWKYNDVTYVWEQMGDDLDGDFEDDRFGYDVSLSRDGYTLAVGAIMNNGADGSATHSGQMKIFQYSTMSSSWTQKGQTLYGEFWGNSFGWSVSMGAMGSIVAVVSQLCSLTSFEFSYSLLKKNSSLNHLVHFLIGSHL